MAVVRARRSDLELLGRLMRAEAEGEGKLGMLMVGNVGVNRVRADCLDFKQIRTIPQMVYQRPGGYEATLKGYFYQRARERDVQLARKAVRGQRHHPASNALWFVRPPGRACPRSFFGQRNVGKFKNHCFFVPRGSECPGAYR